MKSNFNARLFLILVLISALFAGISYAQNKVVVIPLDAQSSVKVDALLARIAALEAKLACVDTQSDAGRFILEGCDVAIRTSFSQEIKLEAGTSSFKLSQSEVSIQASGVIALDASIISGNGGSAPVARVGDTVVVDPNSGVGVIVQGSQTVFF